MLILLFVQQHIKIKQISISNPDVERHDAYASFTINDSLLSQYYDIWIGFAYTEPKNIHLYEFDLKKINYEINVVLSQKSDKNVDEQEIESHIEKLIHNIYQNVGQEKTDAFELQKYNGENLKIINYSENNIIWDVATGSSNNIVR